MFQYGVIRRHGNPCRQYIYSVISLALALIVMLVIPSFSIKLNTF
nr:MAG TPA: hypothetical protein [Myoviridae sp. ctNPX13]